MDIFFIRDDNETKYGPFFSSLEKAIAYLKVHREDDEDDKDTEWLKAVIRGDDTYTSIERVMLNDVQVRYDG